jgi:hypothetical protein
MGKELIVRSQVDLDRLARLWNSTKDKKYYNAWFKGVKELYGGG